MISSRSRGATRTADIPGLPVKALYTVEMINLETLNSSMMKPR